MYPPPKRKWVYFTYADMYICRIGNKRITTCVILRNVFFKRLGYSFSRKTLMFCPTCMRAHDKVPEVGEFNVWRAFSWPLSHYENLYEASIPKFGAPRQNPSEDACASSHRPTQWNRPRIKPSTSGASAPGLANHDPMQLWIMKVDFISFIIRITWKTKIQHQFHAKKTAESLDRCFWQSEWPLRNTWGWWAAPRSTENSSVTYAFLLREGLGEWVTPLTLMVYPHFRQGAHMYFSFSKCWYMFSSLGLQNKWLGFLASQKRSEDLNQIGLKISIDYIYTLNYSKTSMFQTTTLRRKTVQPFLPLPMGFI